MGEKEEALMEVHSWMAMVYGSIQNDLNGLLLTIDKLEHQFPELKRPELLPPLSMRPPIMEDREGNI